MPPKFVPMSKSSSVTYKSWRTAFSTLETNCAASKVASSLTPLLQFKNCVEQKLLSWHLFHKPEKELRKKVWSTKQIFTTSRIANALADLQNFHKVEVKKSISSCTKHIDEDIAIAESWSLAILETTRQGLDAIKDEYSTMAETKINDYIQSEEFTANLSASV